MFSLSMSLKANLNTICINVAISHLLDFLADDSSVYFELKIAVLFFQHEFSFNEAVLQMFV